MAPVRVLRPIDVAAIAGVATVTVRAWTRAGKLLPRFITPDGWKLYLEADVALFLAERSARKVA